MLLVLAAKFVGGRELHLASIFGFRDLMHLESESGGRLGSLAHAVGLLFGLVFGQEWALEILCLFEHLGEIARAHEEFSSGRWGLAAY